MAILQRAAFLTWGAQYIIFGLSLVRLVIASRILESAEVGAYVLASSLVLLASILRTFGTFDYIVSTEDLSRSVLATCFTIVVVMGVVMGAIYVAAAPWLAEFFAAPELAFILPLMAISFVLLPFGLIGQAVFQREMRFGQLALVRVSGAIAETVCVVALLLSDFGVASLAWGFLTANVIATLLMIKIAPSHSYYRPNFEKTSVLLKFGWKSVLGVFLMRLGELGPPLLLGRTTDTATVGYFGRGQTLINFFRHGIETAMAPVTQPWFAQKARADSTELASGYLRVMELVTVITWPFYAFIFVHAPTIVPLLLGPGWEPSIPVTQALAAGGLFSAHAIFGSSLLAGQGHIERRMWLMGAIQFVRFGLLGIGLAMGLGLTSFAWILAFSHVAAFVLTSMFLRLSIDLSPWKLVTGLAQPAGLAAAIALANALIVQFLGATIPSIVIGVGFTSALWWAAISILNHPAQEVVLGLVQRIAKRI